MTVDQPSLLAKGEDGKSNADLIFRDFEAISKILSNYGLEFGVKIDNADLKKAFAEAAKEHKDDLAKYGVYEKLGALMEIDLPKAGKSEEKTDKGGDKGDKPAENKPAEDKPVEEKPVEEKPADPTPVEGA